MHWLQADAAALSAGLLAGCGALPEGTGADAAICTLGLSVIPDWGKAYRAMLGVVRPGGRVAIMDGGWPEGRMAPWQQVLRPLWAMPSVWRRPTCIAGRGPGWCAIRRMQ